MNEKNTEKLNLFLGFLGLLIIWLSTYNSVAVLGGIVAGLHITYKIEK